LQVYTAVQLKKQFLRILKMPSSSNPQNFVDRARENRLEISLDHASDLGEFSKAVDGAYAVIREIDTTGFEPDAIFVPTFSKREAE
jgi:hypothetical protein